MVSDPQSTPPPVIAALDHGVLRLTLARPPAHVLDDSMIAALTAAIAEAGADKTARVILIGSSGPIFSAGHDLKAVAAHRRDDADGGRAYLAGLFDRCTELMLAIAASPRPVIAMVDGIATAAGCQLVAACDLAVASERARFCTPGVDIGGFCTTPLVEIGRAVNRKHAMEMALTGAMIAAADALRFGLVNRVVPAAALEAEALALARAIAAKPAATIALGKRAFAAQIGLPLAEAYAAACPAMVEGMLSAEAGEGIDAFIARRPPRWPS